MHKLYSKEQWLEVREMAEKGVSDGIIAKKTGVHLAAVSQLSTDYWKEKMDSKPTFDE